MSVKSLDVKQEERAAALDSIRQHIESGDMSAAAKAFVAWADVLQQQTIAEAREYVNMTDTQVLAQRGVRQLTSEEKSYWQKFIEAAKSTDPRQAVTNIDVAMPKSTIDAVFENLVSEHPLLEVIDFQNATGVTEWLIHKGEKQLATWSKLCDDIVKELAGDFELVSLTMAKLSAFIPICKAMLDLGPAWLDRYVRAILAEAIAFGLEEGIINGTGLDQPIGMIRDLSAAVDPATGYAAKTATAVTKLDVATYGALVARLAKSESGRNRKVRDLVLIVSVADYYSKVMPATTYLNPLGSYVNDILPVPTRVIVSEQIADGTAVLGMGGRYWFGLGTAKSGKIEYSDEYRFLEDERVYLTKLYGTGKPKDNTSFLVLDIENLEPTLPKVETVTAAVSP